MVGEGLSKGWFEMLRPDMAERGDFERSFGALKQWIGSVVGFCHGEFRRPSVAAATGLAPLNSAPDSRRLSPELRPALHRLCHDPLGKRYHGVKRGGADRCRSVRRGICGRVGD